MRPYITEPTVRCVVYYHILSLQRHGRKNVSIWISLASCHLSLGPFCPRVAAATAAAARFSQHGASFFSPAMALFRASGQYVDFHPAKNRHIENRHIVKSARNSEILHDTQSKTLHTHTRWLISLVGMESACGGMGEAPNTRQASMPLVARGSDNAAGRKSREPRATERRARERECLALSLCSQVSQVSQASGETGVRAGRQSELRSETTAGSVFFAYFIDTGPNLFGKVRLTATYFC